MFKTDKKEIANLEDFVQLSEKDKRQKLPKGQYIAKKWPVLSVEKVPTFNGVDWNITVDGEVNNPAKWSWKEFLELPKVEQISDLHCVTTWSLLDQKFGGVKFSTIVDIVQPNPNAKFVTFEAKSGYTSALPIYDGYLLEHDVLLAYEHEDQPLPSKHGGPLRSLVPQLYLWKSVKWLSKMTFHTEWERGFWETRGYHQRGDPWLEERYSSQEKPIRREHKI
ncbi:MAG: molybdopterin-dependent oxidoreductase [Candidatus Heimdallarchaeota archaeon]|nr:molybdopterin-dependent oxidoreductase [Candidatus Heimdallarchaeota archaeon]